MEAASLSLWKGYVFMEFVQTGVWYVLWVLNATLEVVDMKAERAQWCEQPERRCLCRTSFWVCHRGVRVGAGRAE